MYVVAQAFLSGVRITRDSDIGLEFLRRRGVVGPKSLWEMKLKPQPPASRKPTRQRRDPDDQAEWAMSGPDDAVATSRSDPTEPGFSVQCTLTPFYCPDLAGSFPGRHWHEKIT